MGQLLEGSMDPVYTDNTNNTNNNNNQQQPNQPQQPPAPAPATVDDTPTDYSNYYFTCRACNNVVIPFSAVLPKQIGVWSKTVYSYQLEDVLPHDKETGQACFVYSATNPGEHRFDVFRVAAEDAEKEWVAGELTLRVENTKFTPSHSWFPGFSWCMVGCQHCGTHLGWGFSKTRRSDRELPSPQGQQQQQQQRANENDNNNNNDDGFDDDDDDAINEDGEEQEGAAADNNDQQQQQQRRRAREPEEGGGDGGGGGGAAVAAAGAQQPTKTAAAAGKEQEQEEAKTAAAAATGKVQEEAEDESSPRRTDFIGVIFSSIRHKEMPAAEFKAFMAKLRSVRHRSGMALIASAWPALPDPVRRALLENIKNILKLYDDVMQALLFVHPTAHEDDDGKQAMSTAKSSSSSDNTDDTADQHQRQEQQQQQKKKKEQEEQDAARSTKEGDARKQMMRLLDMLIRHRFGQFLGTAAAFVVRVREREAAGEPLLDHGIPMLRAQVEQDYQLQEDETEEAAMHAVLTEKKNKNASAASSISTASAISTGAAAAASSASSDASVTQHEMSSQEILERCTLYLFQVFVRRWDAVVPGSRAGGVVGLVPSDDDDDDDDDDEGFAFVGGEEREGDGDGDDDNVDLDDDDGWEDDDDDEDDNAGHGQRQPARHAPAERNNDDDDDDGGDGNGGSSGTDHDSRASSG